MQTVSQKNNLVPVSFYLQAGWVWYYKRLALCYDSRWVHFSSVGNGTLMHITDMTDDTGSSKWREVKRSAKKSWQQSWTDGQMFVLVWVEKNTVFTQSRTESGPSQLTGGIQNTASQEGILGRQKKAFHKWVKPGVRVLLGIIEFSAAVFDSSREVYWFRLATVKWIHTGNLNELH